MTKSSRRTEHVQASRGPTLPEKTLPSAPETGETPSPAPERDPVGRYWVVIVVWAVGFAALVAFEAIAALFRR